MGKRQFDVSTAELKAWDSGMSLDQGVGTATRDMRIVWANGATARYLDLYTEHPTEASEPGNISEIAFTSGAGAVTGLLRVNYEDTQSIDRVLAGMRACEKAMQIRGKGLDVDWFGSPQMMDDVLGCMRLAIMCMEARGRAEAHVASN